MAEISSTGDHMLSVLEMVGRDGPVSAAQVAKLCDVNRTVAHRLLTTLASRSFVRRTEQGYVLGPTLVRLGRMAEIGLKETAKIFMMKLARRSGETVVLHVLDRAEAVVLDQAVGTQHLVRVEHTPGSRHPLCLGASGWSILAFQSDKVIQRILKARNTDTATLARIAQVRRDGFAISHDELQLGVHGLAAPIFDKNQSCIASIALLVPAVRSKLLIGFKDDLVTTANNLILELALAEPV